LACGVHIFIPSIGKPGGCNPIPIPKWTVANHEIVISKSTLESGLKYFSDVVEVMATDPVNGEKISNMEAEHSYSFSGKTYFFTSEQSYDAFRDDPWKYADVEPLNPLGE
jgi:YHS domain-containing protein